MSDIKIKEGNTFIDESGLRYEYVDGVFVLIAPEGMIDTLRDVESDSTYGSIEMGKSASEEAERSNNE